MKKLCLILMICMAGSSLYASWFDGWAPSASDVPGDHTVAGDTTLTGDLTANSVFYVNDTSVTVRGVALGADDTIAVYGVSGSTGTFDIVTCSSYTHTDPIWIYGDLVRIGDTGTINFADGDGDLYIEDELEVDGLSYLGGKAFLLSGGSVATDWGFEFGGSGNYSIGYKSSVDEWRFLRGGNIHTDTNVAFRITASTVVAIGDAGSMDFTTSSGDLYVEHNLEVDGQIFVDKFTVEGGDGIVDFQADDGYAKIYDNVEFKFGDGNDYSFGYDSGADEARLVIGGNIEDDDAVAWRVTASTVVAIGDAGTMNSAAGSGDLYVEHNLEVDQSSYLKNVNISNQLVMSGKIVMYSQTEAELKALNPGGVGRIYYDSTNFAVITSTGTAAGSFGLITDGTQLPVGW